MSDPAEDPGQRELAPPLEPTPGAASETPRGPDWAIALAFIVLSLVVTVVGSGQRSGWVHMTLPLNQYHTGNTLLGYSYVLDGQPIMKENLPTLRQMAFFNAHPEAWLDFYAYRAGYAFLACLLAPVLGLLGATHLLNWLAWLLAAWVGWRLAGAMFEDRLTRILTVALIGGGLGFVLHANDLSAHQASFTLYYLGTWLLYTSRIHIERRPWSVHLQLGIFLAAAGLIYSGGVALTACYLLLGLRHNRLAHIVGVALIGFSGRALWQWTLGAFFVSAPIHDVEAEYLRQALSDWWVLTSAPLLESIPHALRLVGEFLTLESPLVVACGLVASVALARDRAERWFGAVIMSVPLGAAFVFSIRFQARGYLIYGVSLWLFLWVAYLLARELRQPGAVRRRIAIVGVVVCLGSHFSWSTAHMRHWEGPSQSYFLGIDEGWPHLFGDPTRVAALTGLEPAPALWGGQASDLLACGAESVPPRPSNHFPQGPLGSILASRVVHTIYFGLLLFLFLPAALKRRRLQAVLAWVVVVFASSGLAWLRPPQLPQVLDPDSSLKLPQGSQLEYRTALSADILDELRAALRAGGTLVVFVPHTNTTQPDVSFFAGERRLDAELLQAPQPRQYRLTPSAFEALQRARSLTVRVRSSSEEAVIMGWQRRDLPDRSLSITPRPTRPPRTLPAVELRVWREDGSLALLGF